MLLLLLLMMTAFASFPVSAAGAKVTTVNVLNYGANGQDGIDDTIAIQKALNTALNLGGTDMVKVVFPKGRYIVCAPEGYSVRSLKIYSNTILEFEEGAEIMRSENAPNSYVFTSASQHQISFIGGIINGNVCDTKVARGIMSLRDITGLKLENVDFTSFCGTHAVLLDGISSLDVNGCSFKDFKLFTGTPEEYREQTNATSYWASEALHIDFNFYNGRPMANVSVTNCTFENCASGVGTHHVIEGYIGQDIKIRNNTFNNCYYCGCNATAFTDFEFSGNVAVNTPTLLLAQNVKGSIHDNYSDSSGLKVSTNTMKNIYQFGINCMELYKMNAISVSNNKDRYTGIIKTMNSTDVEIYNNTICVGAYMGTNSDANCGIKVYNGAKANVYNNTVGGDVNSGICSDNSFTQITGNTVYNCADGIKVIGGSDCSVENNSAVSCGKGVCVYRSTAAQVSGNKTDAPILLSFSEGSVLTDNNVLSGGITLEGGTAERIGGNVISSVGSDALSLTSGAFADAVEGNSFFNNKGADLSLTEGSRAADVKGNVSDKNSILTDDTSTIDELVSGDIHVHSFMTRSTKAARCASAGSVIKYCSDCGLEYCSQLYAPTRHSYSTSVKAPSYTSGGKTTHICAACRRVYYDNYTQALTLADVSGMKALANSAAAVKLSWNKVSGAGSYAVYVYNKELKRWQYYKTVSTNTVVVGGLNAGEAYAFTARAIMNTASGKVMSPNFENYKTSTKPARVSFTVKSAKPKTAVVNWSKVKGATSYAVFYKTKTSSWVKLATVNNKTTSFTKTGLKEGGAYYFTVRAYRTYEGVTYGGDFTAKGVTVKSAPKVTETKKVNK